MGATSTVAPGHKPGGAGGGTHNTHANKQKRTTLSIWQVLHLLHRLGILASAISYVVICLCASKATLDLLKDKDRPSVVGAPDAQYLMGSYIGAATIRESPLVMLALQGDTSPRNGTLYLEATGPSLSICKGIMVAQHDIYTDTFLRSMYDQVVQDTQYNLTFMAYDQTELIMPVVDCVSSAIILGYLPTGKFNFLVRQKQNPDDVAIVTIQLSNQEYRILDQNERNSAAIATLALINDLRAKDVDHHFIASIGYPYAEFDFRVYQFLGVTNEGMWQLETIPDEARGDIPKILVTAFRSGFYMKSETEQFNINNQVNVISHKPLEVITQWASATKTVMHDSWAWVHGLEFLLGLDLLLSLLVLVLVVYRNVQAGKFWIGDAFVAISTKLQIRGALVLLSWYLNGFWSVFEFCVRDSYRVLGLDLNIYEDIMRADLLGLYLSLCGLLGVLFRERVDPLFAMLCFCLGYELRGKLIFMLPKTAAEVANYGYNTFVDGVPPYLEGQELISPMGYWTSHELHNHTFLMILKTLSPLLLTLVLIVAYIVFCKVRRFFFPEKMHVLHNNSSNVTGTSSRDESMLMQKRVLTLFEIATGAELESSFGLMSSFENYLMIKGMKFASADGIYSNGFVIANSKFVLQTGDYWTIVLMKLLRRQFKSVYVYEISGSTVQQTARLVYPSTFTFADLINLNISVLS
ncbi:Transmembrane protein [Globisporangium polare]